MGSPSGPWSSDSIQCPRNGASRGIGTHSPGTEPLGFSRVRGHGEGSHRDPRVLVLPKIPEIHAGQGWGSTCGAPTAAGSDPRAEIGDGAGDILGDTRKMGRISTHTPARAGKTEERCGSCSQSPTEETLEREEMMGRGAPWCPQQQEPVPGTAFGLLQQHPDLQHLSHLSHPLGSPRDPPENPATPKEPGRRCQTPLPLPGHERGCEGKLRSAERETEREKL